MQAIFEVYTDLLVERADGSVDQALLWILRQDIKECCVRVHLLTYSFGKVLFASSGQFARIVV